MSFKNKAVLITGVSGGLGHAFSKCVLQDGGTVYALGRNAPEDLVREELFHFQECDLRNPADIPAAVEDLCGGVRKIELVILNAGVKGEVCKLSDMSLEVIEEVVCVNVYSGKVILDQLLLSGREIEQVMGISSKAAEIGSDGMGAYAISKAALNIMLRVYSRENPDIHFASVAPGLVNTRMMTQLTGYSGEVDFASIKRMRSKLGTPDMQEPMDAARRVLNARSKLRSMESGAFVDIREID